MSAKSGLSRVAGYQQKSPPAWRLSLQEAFSNKIFLDWLLTLTTQPSISKRCDNPAEWCGVKRGGSTMNCLYVAGTMTWCLLKGGV